MEDGRRTLPASWEPGQGGKGLFEESGDALSWWVTWMVAPDGSPHHADAIDLLGKDPEDLRRGLGCFAIAEDGTLTIYARGDAAIERLVVQLREADPRLLPPAEDEWDFG